LSFTFAATPVHFATSSDGNNVPEVGRREMKPWHFDYSESMDTLYLQATLPCF
ncbi:hypothetical protein LINPERHAP2_LOCUS23849, partial [Linum perenne]